jgi:hypothetical protein
LSQNLIIAHDSALGEAKAQSCEIAFGYISYSRLHRYLRLVNWDSGGMIHFGMKRWRVLILALAVVALFALGARHALERTARQNMNTAITPCLI